MTTEGSRFDQMPPTLPPDRRPVDPFVAAMASLAGIVAVGFATLALGWHAVSRTVIEAGQLPGLVSGTTAGIALIALGCGLAVVLHGRRSEAVLRVETDRVLAAGTAVLRALDGSG